MKVTFIRPSMMRGARGDSLQPLVFAILAGLTPSGVERVLYDDRIEAVPFDEPTDLVALTVETATAKRAYQIAAEYHARGVPTVMGGCHPTLAPEEALRYATSIVVGDAEGVWGDVLVDAAAGALRPVYESRGPALDSLRIDRGILRSRRYRPVALVQFSRGCRFHCDFCSVRAFYGSSIRHRPVAEVVDEVKSLRGRHVFFVDDNIFVDPDRAGQLFEALVPLNASWSCQASLDAAGDGDLLRLMRRAGCRLVTVGFESMIGENLDQMGKGWNLRHGDYGEIVRAFHEHGIMVYGTFVFGYDHDTVESFDLALDFAIQSKLCLANFNPLCPTPGTPLYERLKMEGRLINDPWWLHPDYRYGESMFHPRGMTAAELTEGCYRARSRFNTYRSILRRSLGRGPTGGPANLPGFSLLVNVISRRQIHRKQGAPLGDGELPAPVYEEGRA
jgi:radical SAM superfamily enzyme YgiQ (UPF0313 family)